MVLLHSRALKIDPDRGERKFLANLVHGEFKLAQQMRFGRNPEYGFAARAFRRDSMAQLTLVFGV